MANIHHHDKHLPTSCKSSNHDICSANPKVPSAFHSIQSLMRSSGPSYPTDQEGCAPQMQYGPYGVIPQVDKTQRYLPPLWAHSPPHLFYNNSDDQSQSIPACGDVNILLGRPNCLVSSRFNQQLTVSDLSVNPFEDQSTFDNKKDMYLTPGCLETHISQVAIPANSLNDEVFDVVTYSPFGSPVDSEGANQTNVGPGSTSSVGYSSGYQSCEGSTDNSPFRPISGNPTQSFHIRQTDNYQPALYLPQETTLPQRSAPDLSLVISKSANLPPASPFIPSERTTNPSPVQSVELPLPFAPRVESAQPSLLVTPDSEAPPKPCPADDTQVKKSRVKYTSVQLDILEKAFKDTPYPDWDEMEELSKKLDIAEQKIKVWFQNKRARWRKKHNARQLQEVSAFKPLQQTSALYRFPSSFSSFQPPLQKPVANLPLTPPAPRMSIPGQSLYTQHSYRVPFVPAKAMTGRPQTNPDGFYFKTPIVESSAYYQPHTNHNGATGVSHIPESNYYYGQMPNHFPHSYM